MVRNHTLSMMLLGALVLSSLLGPPQVQANAGGPDEDPAVARDHEVIRQTWREVYNDPNAAAEECRAVGTDPVFALSTRQDETVGPFDTPSDSPGYTPTDTMLNDTMAARFHPTRLYVDAFEFDEFGGLTLLANNGIEVEEVEENNLSEAAEASLGLREYVVLQGGSPLDAAIALNAPRDPETGDLLDSPPVLASPDYQVYPAGPMYFPGTLPVPRSLPTDTRYETYGGGAVVNILDTGIDERAISEVDHDSNVANMLVYNGGADAPYAEDDSLVPNPTLFPNPAALNYVGGHGEFVAGVVAQQFGTGDEGLTAWAVNPEGTPVFYESDVEKAAARARLAWNNDVGRQSSSTAMLSNLSLGTRTCGHLGKGPQANPADSVPLVSLRTAISHLLANEDDLVVVAAGNSGEDREVSYPAALFDQLDADTDAELLARYLGAEPDLVEARIDDLRSRVVSVGAADGSRIADYSTAGDWIDVYAEGCHISNYPDGEFLYPGGVDRTFDTGAAEWCGSSFAAAMVSGQIAAEWNNTGSLLDARDRVLGQYNRPQHRRLPGGVTELAVDPMRTRPEAAVEICQNLFPVADSARSVILSRDDAFPDSLAGAPLAGDDSCILFTPTDTLTDAVHDELRRVLPDCGKVYILGGTAAIAASIEADLRAEHYEVTRLEGPTRVETALAVADEVLNLQPGQREILLSRSDNYADSVTGGAYGAETGSPLVLSQSEALHPETRDWLIAQSEAGRIALVTLLGGEVALSKAVLDELESRHSSVRRIGGADRMWTAARMALDAWGAARSPTADSVLTLDLNYGDQWITALAAAPYSARYDAPQLGLWEVSGERPPATEYALREIVPRTVQLTGP